MQSNATAQPGFHQLRNSTCFFLSVIFLLLITGCNNNEKATAATTDAIPVKEDTVAVTTPAAPPANFKHQTATVNGLKLHYVIGGQGEPLVLVHGFGQNWYMWNRLLPELSKHFTVIAPDLRGLGESDKPATGYDKKQWPRTSMNW